MAFNSSATVKSRFQERRMKGEQEEIDKLNRTRDQNRQKARNDCRPYLFPSEGVNAEQSATNQGTALPPTPPQSPNASDAMQAIGITNEASRNSAEDCYTEALFQIRNQIRELETEVSSLKGEIISYKEDLDTLREDLIRKAGSPQFNENKARMKDLEGLCRETQAQLRQREEELEDARSEKDTIERKLKKVEAEQRHDVDQLQQEVADPKTASAKITTPHPELHKSHQEIQGEIDPAEDEKKEDLKKNLKDRGPKKEGMRSPEKHKRGWYERRGQQGIKFH